MKIEKKVSMAIAGAFALAACAASGAAGPSSACSPAVALESERLCARSAETSLEARFRTWGAALGSLISSKWTGLVFIVR